MMPGVSSLRSSGVVFPEDGSIHLTDGDEVLAVGDAQQDEALILGEERRKKGESEDGERGECSHDSGT